MSKNNRRVQVSFTQDQYDLIQKFKGVLGNSDSEVVKIITLMWLSEKSLITDALKDNISMGGFDEI